MSASEVRLGDRRETPLETSPPIGARVPHGILVGVCVLYTVWIFVMPPFAGSDEFDHSYRAAAAARGEWLIEPTAATRGTGAWLEVPDDIVRAAHPECTDLRYTTDRDCVGTPLGDGTTRVASGAGRYHPLFYAVIGTVAKPFDGATALIVMRCATALLAGGFLWLALVAVGTWARTRWPYLTVAVACTPVALYSSAIASPNGVEMMAALALWTSLVGLAHHDAPSVRRLAVTAGIAGATLATLRPLGPLWALLVLVTVLNAVRPPSVHVRALLRRVDVLLAAGLVFLSAVQSLVWIIAVDALKIGYEGHLETSLAYKVGVSAKQIPAWILQAIAAFPLRNDPAPPMVYACYLLLFGAALVLGWRCADRRIRWSIAFVVAVALLFPYASTVASFDQYRAAWQGRYGLPLTIGLVVLAGLSLDRAGRPLRGSVRTVSLLLFVAAQSVSPVNALLLEMRQSPQVGSAAWWQPSPVVVAVVAASAAALMWWSAASNPRTEHDVPS